MSKGNHNVSKSPNVTRKQVLKKSSVESMYVTMVIYIAISKIYFLP